MKIAKYGKPDESLYETIERAMRANLAVLGVAGEVTERFATINAAIEHANTYGIETLFVRHMYTNLAKTDDNLAKLCVAACAHARVGKFRAAERALDDAREIAMAIGLTYRLKHPTMVIAHCRRTIASTDAPDTQAGE